MKNRLFGFIGTKDAKPVKVARASGKTRQATIILKYKGQKVTLAELAQKHKIKYITAYWRHVHGWAPAEIVAGVRK